MKDHVRVLQAVNDLPFGVGKKLLTAYLRGDPHKSIQRNNLDEEPHYATLNKSSNEVRGLITKCLTLGYLTYQPLPQNKNIKVITLTKKGLKEKNNPSESLLPENQESTPTTETEKQLLETFQYYLQRYNEGQKRAIITPAKHALCIAGAGTGKTTVLTKRIQHLATHTPTDPSDILAITFTRKARDEMQQRLIEQGVSNVQVHTFNSFAENLLQRHSQTYYGDKPARLAEYRDKVRATQYALQQAEHSVATAASVLYSKSKQNRKTTGSLQQAILRDTFQIVDFHKATKEESIHEFQANDAEERLLKELAEHALDYLEEKRLRLHIDQILHATDLLKNHPSIAPTYQHVLVDEYQDINDRQMSMINALKPEHLFCVGDPRQSIYGWRGSRIKYITEFDTYYENPTVITLQTNYRSDKSIINLANTVIEPMLLPPLKPHSDAEGTVTHTYHTNKHDEKDHVRRIIKNQPKPVYVLARRNKQLQDLSDHLDKHGIKHELKRDQDEEAKQDVLLATIHASKGLEAPTVVLLSANARNHPLQVSEHPVIETLQPDTYDRDAEERRLLYVALTRAQRELHVTYTGKRSKYLPYSQKQRQKQESQKQSKTLEEALKAWRKKQSKAGRVPEFKVLPNSALRAILDDEPVSEEELRGIWGFTPKRIKKYGSEIISIVRDYA